VNALYAFVGFALLIILHELGHFAAAKAVGMRVERFSLFFPPLLGRVRRGETEYAIGAIPLGGYVKISGMSPDEDLPPEVVPRAYLNQPVWKRVVVITAGPAVNLVIAFVLIWLLLVAQGQVVGLGREVGPIDRGSPAAAVLREGDEIVSVDGVTEQEDMPQQIAAHICAGQPKDGCRAVSPATLVVERDGRRRTIEVTPVYDARLGRTRLGFSFSGREYEAMGAGEAVGESFAVMWNVTELTVTSIAKLFYDEEARKEVSGVVGSYEVTRQSFDAEFELAVRILALISLSLAVINLFPFLPLDGGHIFWAVAEKVRGRRIPFHVMEKASVVGFVLVIALFAIGFSNDLGRLTGEGFDVR